MFSSRCALVRLSELLLFVLIFTAATARPTVDFVTRDLFLNRSPPRPDTPSPQSFAHDAQNQHAALKVGNLHARMMPGVTPVMQTIKMKHLHFTKLGVALLSAKTDFAEAMRETTQMLENFYFDIAYKAQDEWSQLPQMQSFNVDDPSGRVRLSFSCIGDTIPWSFVKAMAERLWQSATLGMAELFEVMYASDDSTIGVRITLDLIEGLSSGAGSRTREGSVPSITSPKD